MSHATPPSLSHFHPDELTWLKEAAKEARREWEGLRRQGGPAEKAEVLACLSGIVCDLEGPDAALRLSRRAHRLWKAAADPYRIASSGAVLAVRLLDAGRPQEALQQSAEAREAMRLLNPPPQRNGVSRVSHAVGKDFLVAGHAAEAQAWLELALENPTDGERADILAQLSRALDLQGDLPGARERQQEACAAFHSQGKVVAGTKAEVVMARVAMAEAMVVLARLELRLGRHWEAATLCKEAAPILERWHCEAEAAEARELHRLCLGGRKPAKTSPRIQALASCARKWL